MQKKKKIKKKPVSQSFVKTYLEFFLMKFGEMKNKIDATEF